MRKILRNLYLASFGGTLYAALEIAWRGHTHWTMLVLGGAAFLAILSISDAMPISAGLLARCAVCGLAVTAMEFLTGAAVNLWLGWRVWDYSDMPASLLGQVCLPFTLMWMLLSAPAIILGGYLRRGLFGEAVVSLPLLPAVSTRARP